MPQTRDGGDVNEKRTGVQNYACQSEEGCESKSS